MLMSIQVSSCEPHCESCVTDHVARQVHLSVSEHPEVRYWYTSHQLEKVEKVCLPRFEQGIIYKNYEMRTVQKPVVGNTLLLKVRLLKSKAPKKRAELLSSFGEQLKLQVPKGVGEWDFSAIYDNFLRKLRECAPCSSQVTGVHIAVDSDSERKIITKIAKRVLKKELAECKFCWNLDVEHGRLTMCQEPTSMWEKACLKLMGYNFPTKKN